MSDVFWTLLLFSFIRTNILVFTEHYQRFLKRMNYKEPGLSEALKAMPAMLADRATDLGGRRGNKALQTLRTQVPEADEDEYVFSVSYSYNCDSEIMMTFLFQSRPSGP